MRIEAGRIQQQAVSAYDRQSPHKAEAALALLASRRSEVAVKLGPFSVGYETETAPDPRAAAREAAALLARVQAFEFGDALDAAEVGRALGARSAYASNAAVQSDAGLVAGQFAGVPGAGGSATADETQQPRPTRSPAAGARAYGGVARRVDVPNMLSARV